MIICHSSFARKIPILLSLLLQPTLSLHRRTWYNSRAINVHMAIACGMPIAKPTTSVTFSQPDRRDRRVAFVPFTAMRYIVRQ